MQEALAPQTVPAAGSPCSDAFAPPVPWSFDIFMHFDIFHEYVKNISVSCFSMCCVLCHLGKKAGPSSISNVWQTTRTFVAIAVVELKFPVIMPELQGSVSNTSLTCHGTSHKVLHGTLEKALSLKSQDESQIESR